MTKRFMDVNNWFSFFFLAVGVHSRLILGNPCLAALSKKNSVFYENDVVPVSLQNSHISVKNFTVGPKALAEIASCKSADDHTKLWTIERGLALALVPLVPAAFMFPSAPMDYLLAISFTLHAHWYWKEIITVNEGTF